MCPDVDARMQSSLSTETRRRRAACDGGPGLIAFPPKKTEPHYVPVLPGTGFVAATSGLLVIPGSTQSPLSFDR